jgi:hypothetical protein
MSAKILFLIMVVVGSILLAVLWGDGSALLLILLLVPLGVADAYGEYKKTRTKMSAGQWILANLMGLHVQYAREITLTPYNVALPHVLATIKGVLTMSHRDTSFWNIRLVDEPTGMIQAILKFVTDPLRPNDENTQNMIVLIAQVSTDEEGKSAVKFEYEVSANHGRMKDCEEVIKSTTSTIEEKIKELETPRDTKLAKVLAKVKELQRESKS